jgi:hypothetical protein
MSPAFARVVALSAIAALAAAPNLARANGQPVVSLPLVPLGQTNIMIYSDRPQPVITYPVRRVISSGENTEVEYDTSSPQMVTSCPNPRSVGSGENSSVECDASSAAAASHAMPNVSGGHNFGLWNLRSLPPSVR